MFSCNACNEISIDDERFSVDRDVIERATKNGFLPSTLRDIAGMVGNPSVAAEDMWLLTLKQRGQEKWTLCSTCHAEINGHLLDPESGIESAEYDTFISYATEDTEFANRLAGGLIVRGLNIWYAPISLNVGDSILSGIEDGLRKSRTGTLVVTETFLKKPWTNYELDILLRQAIEKRKKLLQVWHEISKEQIEKRYMGLTGLLAIDASVGLRRTINSIARALTEFAPLRATTPLWESPRYRFLVGKGEIQLQKMGGASTSIFEMLVNFGPEYFPLALDGELFTRKDLARHAKKAMDNDFGIAQRWTDSVDVLVRVIEEEGFQLE